SLDKFLTRKFSQSEWEAFAASLDYVPLAAGANALKEAVDRAAEALGAETRRVHYLSVPPSAALLAVQLRAQAELTERSRIIREKPFGTDLPSAVALN
ncbi:glucose-6-phosphate dehydrogenase, partial [Rhizobium ruizarguesonis]